jgi:hypothetical protein
MLDRIDILLAVALMILFAVAIVSLAIAWL